GLPDELVVEILGKLEENEDKLSAALTCRRFLTAIHKKLPLATAVCGQFSGNHSECRASLKSRSVTSVLTFCQCESHGRKQMMHLLLPRLSKDVSSLSLESELIGERLSDSAAHAMLDGCSSAPLSSISFEHVDFTAVRPWTLALIASFHRLQEVHLLSCILPRDCCCGHSRRLCTHCVVSR
ncbi:hypothetical protein PENTCL1PPCAC_13337, partial [Pristionchus entomophagus]